MDPKTFENFPGKNPVSGKNPDFSGFQGNIEWYYVTYDFPSKIIIFGRIFKIWTSVCHSRFVALKYPVIIRYLKGLIVACGNCKEIRLAILWQNSALPDSNAK